MSEITVLFLKSLTGNELKVWSYLRICGVTKNAPTQDKIADDLNIARSTVQNALAGLDRKGAIQRAASVKVSQSKKIVDVRIPAQPRKRTRLTA